MNKIGIMVNEWWLEIPRWFKNVTLNVHQMMPNHLHGIIVITKRVDDRQSVGAGFMPARNAGFMPARTNRATTRVAPTETKPIPTLGDIIGAFKSLTTREYINGVKNDGWPPFDKRLWQRNYYEHVIRNETDLNQIREYIINNPQIWDGDQNNPKNLKISQ